MSAYQVYIDRLRDLSAQETAQYQIIAELKAKRGLVGKQQRRQAIEDAEQELETVRSEIENLCAQLERLRKNEGDRVMQQQTWFEDELPQEYNEVVGICYGKAILVTDSGLILWFDAPQPEIIEIGDCELVDGLIYPLSALPTGERKMILSYLLEAGSTPIHYLNILKEEYENECAEFQSSALGR